MDGGTDGRMNNEASEVLVVICFWRNSATESSVIISHNNTLKQKSFASVSRCVTNYDDTVTVLLLEENLGIRKIYYDTRNPYDASDCWSDSLFS